MKTWRSRGTAISFLTSALDGDEWSATRPGRFTTCEISRGTHWIWGWAIPRTSLDVMENRKISTLPVFEPRPCSPPLYRLQTGNVRKEQRAGKKKFKEGRKSMTRSMIGMSRRTRD
jgi:hypothetical protein